MIIYKLNTINLKTRMQAQTLLVSGRFFGGLVVHVVKSKPNKISRKQLSTCVSGRDIKLESISMRHEIPRVFFILI